MSALVDIVVPSRGSSATRSLLLSDLQREMRSQPESSTLVVREGPSAAVNRNAGAFDGEAEWIAFLDDDVRLPVGWLKSLLGVLNQEDPPDVFSGNIGSTRPKNVFSQASEDFVVRHKAYGDLWYLVGAMLIVRRSCFQTIGGFDETFMGAGGEDWAFCSAAHQHGFRVEVIDAISCTHDNPHNMRQLFTRARSYAQGQALSTSTEGQVPTSSEEAGDARAGQDSKHILARLIRWPANEYRELRMRGRSRTRAVTSTLIYVPWMATYLRHVHSYRPSG